MVQLSQDGSSRSTVALLRLGLLGVFLLGASGTLAELLLLEHWEQWTQWAPIAMLGLGLLLAGGWGVWRRPLLLRMFQWLMWTFLAAGVVGVWLHYRGNVEWELESDLSMHGWALFTAALTGATPALAPGTMLQLGLIGLGYTFRHPELAGAGATLKE